MATQSLSRLELSKKIREYEQFANDVLKVDLQKTTALRAKHQQEVVELEELRRNVDQLKQADHKDLKSRVEIGPGVYCRAYVPDTSRLFIAIGLGFHLEVTLEEAGRVIDLRQESLKAQVEQCVDKAARIKANLKFVAEAINELMELSA